MMWFELAEPVIKKWEGLKLTAYLCPAGKWTIGIGTTFYPDGTAVREGDTCTPEQVEEFYQASVNRVAAQLKPLITVDLNANEFAALVSLAYNIGVGAHDGVKGDLADSTLITLLNVGNYLAAADQFLVWNKAHINGKLVVVEGLTNRRRDERTLFLTHG